MSQSYLLQAILSKSAQIANDILTIGLLCNFVMLYMLRNARPQRSVLKNEALLSYVMCLSQSDEVIAVEPGVVTVATGCCAGCVCVKHLVGPSCLGRCNGSRDICPYGKED